MDVLIRRCLPVALALAGLALMPVRAHAQAVSAPELTAAFLFTFVKFTVWPASALAPDAPIRMCVTGDERVASALVEVTRDQTVGGRHVTIVWVPVDQWQDGCHLMYVGGFDQQRANRVIERTAGRPILTLSDSADFAARGGVANFFVESGKLRFAVNPEAADQAQLKISSKLLSLSKIVKDKRHASVR